MSASKKHRRTLIYYPVSRDDAVIRYALKKGKSWEAKLEELSSFISSLEHQIITCQDATQLDRFEYSLGGMKAAEMVCKNHFLYKRNQVYGDASPEHTQIISEVVGWKPIGFCRLFFIVENSKGQRKAYLREPLIKIEEALAKNAKSLSDTYLLSKALAFMLSYSALSGLNDIAEDVLSKLIHENMLPCFGKVSLQRGQERDKQIKALRKSLVAAFDIAAGSHTREIHASSEVIEWTNDAGEKTTVLPAWAVIQYTAKYLTEFRSLPTKKDIREMMERNHEALIQNKDSFWTKVWTESGLSDLPESPAWSTTRKGS